LQWRPITIGSGRAKAVDFQINLHCPLGQPIMGAPPPSHFSNRLTKFFIREETSITIILQRK
jgi:hypothetical protein